MKLKYIYFLILVCFGALSVRAQQSFEFPYAFRENKGLIMDQQGNARHDIDMLLETPSGSVSVGKGQLHYQFMRLEGQSDLDSVFKLRMQVKPADTALPRFPDGRLLYRTPEWKGYRLDMILVGANPDAVLIKEDRRQEQFNYYNPDSKEQHIESVPAFGKITYKDIYPHIDWVLYTRGRELKYDFIVHPGGRASDIRIRYGGADSLHIMPGGDLKIYSPATVITEQHPVAYEKENGQQLPVKFSMHNQQVAFNVGHYSQTLVIDPAVEWATYFGGNGFTSVADVAVDAEGNVYVLANVFQPGSNMVTTGSYQSDLPVSSLISTAVLAKFDNRDSLLWGTYYCGTNVALTSGNGLACDGFGNVYLIGVTQSQQGIATSGALQIGYVPSVNTFYVPPGNPFIVKFNANGVRQWATYYSEGRPIGFNDAVCDAAGNLYLAGYTDSSYSSNYSTTSPNAWQPVFGGGVGYNTYSYQDGLLVKFDSVGNRKWATYYGGEANDAILSITCDSLGNLYISGRTNSTTGIATAGTHQPVVGANFILGQGNDEWGGFIAKFSPFGSRIWGSYLNAYASAIDISANGYLYVSGTAPGNWDTAIVTSDAFQMYGMSAKKDFLMRMDPLSGNRYWGTYYNGTYYDGMNNYYIWDKVSLKTDGAGNVFMAGPATDPGLLGIGGDYSLATPGCYQDSLCPVPPGSAIAPGDGYIVKFDTIGRRKWGTYYGGPGGDNVVAMDIDKAGGAIYVLGRAGAESTTGIATSGTFQPGYEGSVTSNGFLVKFRALDIAVDSALSPWGDTLCAGTYPLTISVSNKGKVTKADSLVIGYTYNGPTIGSGLFASADSLSAGSTQVFELAQLALSGTGLYEIKVYLRYTGDDENVDNDTLRFHFWVNAPPAPHITGYFIGDVYYFYSEPAQEGDTFFWDFGDGTTSAEPTPEHIYTAQDAVYTVTLTLTNACGVAADSIQVQGDGTGLATFDAVRLLKLYPNPAADMVYLESSQPVVLQSYTLVNSVGAVIRRGPLDGNHVKVILDQALPGIYILKVQTNKGIINRKLVVGK